MTAFSSGLLHWLRLSLLVAVLNLLGSQAQAFLPSQLGNQEGGFSQAGSTGQGTPAKQGSSVGSSGSSGGINQRKDPSGVVVPDQSQVFFNTLLEVQTVSTPILITLSNPSSLPAEVAGLELEGPDAPEFTVALESGSLPFTLRPGQSKNISVRFAPQFAGLRKARLRIAQRGALLPDPRIALRGAAYGLPGEELNINAGGARVDDGFSQEWSADFGAVGGLKFLNGKNIIGTDLPEITASTREGRAFGYQLDLASGMESAAYRVTLHFSEPNAKLVGQRIFDVRLEGATVIDDLDLVELVGKNGYHSASFDVQVTDGVLNVDLEASAGRATIAGIDVRGIPMLAADRTEIEFGGVPAGLMGEELLTIANAGVLPLTIDDLTVSAEEEPALAFLVEQGEVQYPGGSVSLTYPLGLSLEPGEEVAFTVVFQPAEEALHASSLIFTGNTEDLVIPLGGLGGHEGHPYLHVVMDVPPLVIDYDADGSELVTLDGLQSHTHEPGHVLTDFEWSEGIASLGSGPQIQSSFPLGMHTVSLTISDDNVPQEVLGSSLPLEVISATEVPGVLVRYYDAAGGSPSALLDAPPAQADFAETIATYQITNTGTAGNSPFTEDVMVRMIGDLNLPSAGNYDLRTPGGIDTRLFVDQVLITNGAPLALSAGPHEIEARFAVNSLADLPVQVFISLNGGVQFLPPAQFLTHDRSGLLPVINSMPGIGTILGGNQIVIAGLGFFPSGSVTVHWGAQDLTAVDFLSEGPDELRFLSPSGQGTISVTVETPLGESNARDFTYSAGGPVPVNFTEVTSVPMPVPTAGAWGPDGRFYVAQLSGKVRALSFDEDYNLLQTTIYNGVSGLSNHEILGLAFNPHEGTSPIRIYVAHAELFANGGSSFSGPSDYTGAVSILEGPNFNTPIPLITNLPASNHDHAVNGMVFDNNGDLLIAVGSNTNAGVIHPNIGDLPESPLSAAILKAQLSKSYFNGVIDYLEISNGLVNNDQVFGDQVEVAPGIHVWPYAVGLRNAFDLLYSTDQRLYATDNGPNFGFGAASTGPASQAGDPQTPDELILVRHGAYYGHPNRSRGLEDARENVYYNTKTASVPGVFEQCLSEVSSSTDGIDEYRAHTFGDAMLGQLLVQKWGGEISRFELDASGESAQDLGTLTWTGGLNLRTGPGGAILFMSYASGRVGVLVPNDVAAIALTAYDIFPWRAPVSGGRAFIIGGEFFGNTGNTQVHFDGVPANILSVSPRRIVGTVPPKGGASEYTVDVTVTVNSEVRTMTDAFTYLEPAGLHPGRWEAAADMPLALGEVACGVIGGELFLVGQGSTKTLTFDLEDGTWDEDQAAPRTLVGHHHAAEVVDGKLYLVGGLGGNSEGRVQIYDPVGNQWSLGTDLPWAGGSVQTAVIDGLIYAAGGIVGATTVDECAVYDPQLDTWTPLASMPTGQGRNHGAAGSDGERLFIFGGRGVGSGAGNQVADGFDTVLIYDPQTDLWESSLDPGSTLAVLPQKRGGMGRALFHQGEFYVFGGETLTGAGATQSGVYDRVDVYDPIANTWRLDAPMTTARHGVFPVEYYGAILLAGGGEQAAFSQSDLLEVFRRP